MVRWNSFSLIVQIAKSESSYFWSLESNQDDPTLDPQYWFMISIISVSRELSTSAISGMCLFVSPKHNWTQFWRSEESQIETQSSPAKSQGPQNWVMTTKLGHDHKIGMPLPKEPRALARAAQWRQRILNFARRANTDSHNCKTAHLNLRKLVRVWYCNF